MNHLSFLSADSLSEKLSVAMRAARRIGGSYDCNGFWHGPRVPECVLGVLEEYVRRQNMTRRDFVRSECERLARDAAQRLGASAWYEHAEKVLTDRERLEVRRILDEMPGSSFWMNAFFAWYNAKVWYRQVGHASWVAYIDNQAIWEYVSKAGLLAELRQRGYDDPVYDPLRVAKVC